MAPARIAFIQYGNFRDALRAKRSGEPSSFRMQYYTMDAYDRIIGNGSALVVNIDTDPYEATDGPYTLIGDRFDPRSSGARYHLDARRSGRRVVQILDRFDPTHISVQTPSWPMHAVGRYALRTGRHLLPFFADYIPAGGWMQQLTNRALARILNHPAVPIVANHHYAASRSLVTAGVDPRKVVPWDYPAQREDGADLARQLDPSRPLQLMYAGALTEAKGVGDLLDAIALAGNSVAATLCGAGDDGEALRARAERLGLDDRVQFLGTVTNEEVRRRMRDADFVVVPSRPSYPEGLAGVISEAFEVGTPLLVSDHPAFALRDGAGCRQFRAGDPAALAAAIREMLDHPEHYGSLVATLDAGWKELGCAVTFAQVFEEWMQWTQTGTEMTCLDHSLAALDAGGSRPASPQGTSDSESAA